MTTTLEGEEDRPEKKKEEKPEEYIENSIIEVSEPEITTRKLQEAEEKQKAEKLEKKCETCVDPRETWQQKEKPKYLFGDERISLREAQKIHLYLSSGPRLWAGLSRKTSYTQAVETYGYPAFWIKINKIKPSLDLIWQETDEEGRTVEKAIPKYRKIPLEGLVTVRGIFLPKNADLYDGYVGGIEKLFDVPRIAELDFRHNKNNIEYLKGTSDNMDLKLENKTYSFSRDSSAELYVLSKKESRAE